MSHKQHKKAAAAVLLLCSTAAFITMTMPGFAKEHANPVHLKFQTTNNHCMEFMQGTDGNDHFIGGHGEGAERLATNEAGGGEA